MTKRNTLFALLFCLLVASVSFAADPNVGTWKLNEKKSKLAPNAPHNTMVVYTEEGKMLKAVVTTVGTDGKTSTSEWVGNFDGKDYAVKGDPNTDMRSVKVDKPGHYTITNKKGGKVTATSTIVMEGKTRTLTGELTDAKGNKVPFTWVYEKQ